MYRSQYNYSSLCIAKMNVDTKLKVFLKDQTLKSFSCDQFCSVGLFSTL